MSIDATMGAPAPTATEERSRRADRRAIVVAGMHRSGTSALTRVMSLLGARLPAHVTPILEGYEHPGYWEPVRIAELHDAALASAGLTWHDFSAFPGSWYASDTAREFKRRLAALLAEEFGDSQLFVAKDPRVCRLVPLWLDPLAELGCEPSFVLSFRNPLEVAASLQRRDGLTLAHALLLWLRHVVDAERATRAFTRTFVSYADLLEDWRRTVSRIATELDLDWSEKEVHRAAPKIEAFLSPALRHFSFTDESVRDREDVAMWVKDTYAALEDAAMGNHAGALEVFERVGATLDEADTAYGPLLADGAARIIELESEAAAAHAHAKELENELVHRVRHIQELEARFLQRVLNRAIPQRRS